MAVLIIITILVLIALVAINLRFNKHEVRHTIWLNDIRGQVNTLCKKTNDAAKAIESASIRIDEHQKAIDGAYKKIESQSKELMELSSKLSVSYEKVRNDGSKKYSDEVKQECVNFVLNNNVSIRGAARALGMPESTLRLWLKSANY